MIKRIKRWFQRRRALAALRAANICTTCFGHTDVRWKSRGCTPGSWGWELYCPTCEAKRDELTAAEAKKRILQAARVLLKEAGE